MIIFPNKKSGRNFVGAGRWGVTEKRRKWDAGVFV